MIPFDMDSAVRGTVTRQHSSPLGTPGSMILDNGFACDTLELAWHNNQKGISCIIADTYRSWVWTSPTLGRLVIRLEDKHGRSDCLCHNGTWAGDPVDVDGDGVNEITQVHGCTLVGRGYANVQRPDGRLQFGILNSKPTLAELVESLRDGENYRGLLLTYVWADGCEPGA